jgi:hypothetical protein
MAFNAKEGGDVNNYATNVVAGGYSDADVVGVGGAGILGGNVPPTCVAEIETRLFHSETSPRKEKLLRFQLTLCPDGVYREKC